MSGMEKEVSDAAGRNRKDTGLTEGKLWDKILFFAMPIVI